MIRRLLHPLFPTPKLARYFATAFLWRSLGFLIFITVVLQSLDLMAHSDKILADERNGFASLVTYVLLRSPELISKFGPFCFLLGSIVTLVQLNQHSETIIAKSAGLSRHQILAPLVGACLGAGIIMFLFNELIVMQTSANLQSWRESDFKPIPREGFTSAGSKPIWIRDSSTNLHIERAYWRAGADRFVFTLKHISLYSGTEKDGSQYIWRARQARLLPTGWVLDDVNVFNSKSLSTEHHDHRSWPITIAPRLFSALTTKLETSNFLQLLLIRDVLLEADYSIVRLQNYLYQKITRPLSMLLMPLLGCFAGFGLVRSGALLKRAVFSMGLGFAYFVTENMLFALGKLGTVPPLIAAFIPFLLFFCIAQTLIHKEQV